MSRRSERIPDGSHHAGRVGFPGAGRRDGMKKTSYIRLKKTEARNLLYWSAYGVQWALGGTGQATIIQIITTLAKRLKVHVRKDLQFGVFRWKYLPPVAAANGSTRRAGVSAASRHV